MNDVAVVTGYLMYYDLLQDFEIGGSFFSKIDRAVEIAESFCSLYSAEEESGWSGDLDFEDTLLKFINEMI